MSIPLTRCCDAPQMMELGDPMRRGADQGEAYGASIKDSLHNRTLRRKKAVAATTHRKRDANGDVVKEWTQAALSVSRIMQTWRDLVVNDRLLMDEKSEPLWQRKHFQAKETGYARAAAASGGAKGIPASDR